MSDQLVIQFPYSPTEHADALFEANTRSGFIFFGGIVIVVPAIAVQLAWPSALPAFLQALPPLMVAAMWLSIPTLTRIGDARRLKRENADNIGKLETRIFSREGFTPTSNWSAPVPWSKVFKVLETRRFILVYATSDGPFFIPKHAMSASDAAELRTRLQQEFRSRPKQLKLLSQPG